LTSLGFDLSPSVTPILPMVLGDQSTSFAFFSALTDAGLFVSPVRKPAVDRDRIRMNFMATHTDAQVDEALEIVQRCGRALGIIPQQRPRSRIEIRLARPGQALFFARDRAAAPAPPARPRLWEVLLQRRRPLRSRLLAAAGVLADRALELRLDRLRRLARIPQTLWVGRRRILGKLLYRGRTLGH
jgi:hypothetical protein